MSLYFLILALVLQSCCLRADAAVEVSNEKTKRNHFPVFHFISVRKLYATALPEHIGDHE